MLVLGTDFNDLSFFLFHGLQASAEYLIRDTIPVFILVLIITILPRIVTVSMIDRMSA